MARKLDYTDEMNSTKLVQFASAALISRHCTTMITSSGFRKLLKGIVENQNMQFHASAVMLQLKWTSCACGFQVHFIEPTIYIFTIG